MTITGQPIGASAGTPSFTALQSRQTWSAHMANGSGRVLGCVSGFAPGRTPVTLTATSTTWTISAFACVVDAAFTTTQAPYEVAVDANVTGSVVAAGGSARTDILFVTINDTDIDSSGLRSATVNYLSATSVAPARSFLLATISVPASGGGSPTIILNPTYAVAAGGIRPVANTAGLAAFTHQEGAYFDDAANDALVRDDGTNFVYQTVKTIIGGPWKGSAYDGKSQLIHLPTSVVVTPSAGTWTIALPITFPNGILTISATCGDTTSNPTMIYLSTGLSSLSSIVGGILTSAGATISAPVRINLDVWGW